VGRVTAAEATTDDPVWSFLTALPPRIKRQLNRTERLVALVHRAVREQGWTPKQLADRCSHSNDSINPAGVVMYRLGWCADNPADLGSDGRRVHFGCCEDGLIYHVPDDPTLPVTASKCPGNRPPEAST
jgi:hypothetical protein